MEPRQQPKKTKPIHFNLEALAMAQKLILGNFLNNYNKSKTILTDETQNYTFNDVQYSFKVSHEIIITTDPDDSNQPRYIAKDVLTNLGGGFAKVYPSPGIFIPQLNGSVELDTSKAWVVKTETFNQKEEMRKKFIVRIEQEYQFLRDMNIPCFYPVFDHNTCYLVMQKIPEMSLRAYLKTNLPAFDIKLKINIRIFEEVVYLHSHGIVHRDIKPANMMVDPNKNYVIRLIDYGLAIYVWQHDNSSVGTPGYRPPELINRSGEYRQHAFTADFFSVSRSCAYVNDFAGELISSMKDKDNKPLPRSEELELLNRNNSYVKPPKEITTPLIDGLYDINTQMGQLDPNKRKTAISALVAARKLKLKNKDPVSLQKSRGYDLAETKFNKFVKVDFSKDHPKEKLIKYKKYILHAKKELNNDLAFNAFLRVINFRVAKNKSTQEINALFEEITNCVNSNYCREDKVALLTEFNTLKSKADEKQFYELSNYLFHRINQLNIEIKKEYPARTLYDLCQTK